VQPQEKPKASGRDVAIGCAIILGGISALAVLVAFIIGSTTGGSKHTTASTPAPAVTRSAKPVAKKSGSWGRPGDACQPGPDLLMWTKAPGATNEVSALGSYDSPACAAVGKQSTLDMVRTTSPTGPGYCTIVAPASANPGYEAKWLNTTDAPPRPKDALLQVGAGC
jgi:hypothetical protein